MKEKNGLIIEDGKLKIATVLGETDTHYKVEIENSKIKSVSKSKVAFEVAHNALKRAERIKTGYFDK